MKRTALLVWICFCALLLNVLRPATSSAEETQTVPAAADNSKARQIISASDARFLFAGRIDFADTNAPVVIWQASTINIDFSGDKIGLLFSNAKGQNFFNAQVNGSNTVVEISEEPSPTSLELSGFGEGRHHLSLFKRSEAAAGTVQFRGVGLAADAKAWSPATPVFKIKMEFIGDSITVGACNEDGDTDQWDSRRTHNAALSYAALTADAFAADHRNIAVSGMGLAIGWVEQKAGDVWNKVYPNPTSRRVDPTQWTPQIVFVTLGENDDSYPKAHAQHFPTNYTGNYVALVRAIRTSYPAAHIVLLRGGMFGGAQSKPLRAAWESAVTELETSDKAISHFVFKHWAKNHPRVADDRAMADELIAWLKRQEFMKPYL